MYIYISIYTYIQFDLISSSEGINLKFSEDSERLTTETQKKFNLYGQNLTDASLAESLVTILQRFVFSHPLRLWPYCTPNTIRPPRPSTLKP